MLKGLKSLGLLLLLILSSCRPGSYFSLNGSSDVLRHRVKYNGETIGLISLWYTGSSDNWRAIRAANPSLNPKKLKVGEKVAIPRRLLVRSRPMPVGFIERSVAAVHPPLHPKGRLRKEAAIEEPSEGSPPEFVPVEAEEVQPAAGEASAAEPPAASAGHAQAEASASSSASEQEDRLIRALIGE